MSNEKLSTGGASPSANRKKREGEKRKSPCTPLREKGKGKEDRRGSLSEPSSARARTRSAGMRARLREALDADLDIAVRAFNGTADDRRIWASIAWRIGIEEFHYALLNKLSEDSSDNAPRRPAAAFQAFLNDRFPKPESKGGAGSGTASRGFSEFINSGSAVGAKGLSAVVGEAAKAGGAA